jgi:hypothetical protein
MKNIEQQARWWSYAAWTLPFVALAILIGETLLGFDTAPTIFIIVVTYIATSVFWWWWAISKIVYMIKCSHRIEGNFEELKDELKEIKRDVGDRQWREPIDS